MTDDATTDQEAAACIAQALSHVSGDDADLAEAFARAVSKLACIRAPELFVDASNFISAKAHDCGVPDPLRASANEPLLMRKAAALGVLWRWTADPRPAPPMHDDREPGGR